MTEPAGTQGEDLQRPLDESVPAGSMPAGSAAPLRPAVPDPPATPAAPETTATPGAPEATEATETPEALETPEAPDAPEAAAAPAPPAGRRAWAALRRLSHPPARGARAVAVWSRGPAGRLMLSTAFVSAMLASTVTAGAFVVPLAGSIGPPDPSATSAGPPSGSSPPAPTSAPTGAPPVGPTTAPGLRPARSGLPADVLRGWAQQLSVRTAIPVVALQAYGYAELVVTETTPGCRLSWSTLAAIGRVESDHGRIGGAVLQADGRAWPPIFGLALDGADDRRLITDTDNGTLDGDPLYDRAVGPMQFIPATWQRELVDATGDGVADPHNLHDAALAAANYLCRNNRDLSTADHWWQAVLAYNNVQSYAQDVFDTANEYGRRSRG